MNDNDPYHLRTNLLTVALIILILLLAVDLLFRLSPGLLGGASREQPAISAVGYHHQFADSTWYYIYTVFENNGNVYQVWWDGHDWHKKKVTNYREAEAQK